MNTYLLGAGVAGILLGVIHSVLGEVLILHKLRQGSVTIGDVVLKERHIRTLRASWHLVTFFGWGLGAILISLSWPLASDAALSNIKTIIAITFLLTAILWVVGTRGKHPAWVVLLVVAGLVWFS